MATVYHINGTTETVLPASGDEFTLDELQKVVGGFIEALYLPDGRVMYINEEGKLDGLRHNEIATDVARLAGIAPDDFIVGDAIVCGPGETS